MKSSQSSDGPACSRKGSPFIPEDLEEFLRAYGVNRLDDPVPVAAEAAKAWIGDYKSQAPVQNEEAAGATKMPATVSIEGVPDAVSSACIVAFTEAGLQPLLASPQPGAAATIAVPASVCSPLTLQCLVRLLEGAPDDFQPCGDGGDGSDDDMEQRRPGATPRGQSSVPLKTAVELFAAVQHLGMMPRLWPCLLAYLRPMLTELAMEEAVWMAANMLAVAPPSQYRAVLSALFNATSICVSSGLDSEQSRPSQPAELASGVLGPVFWRMCMAMLSGKRIQWPPLVSAVSSNPHVPHPVAIGMFGAACLLCPDGSGGGDTAAATAAAAQGGGGDKSLGPVLDCFLSHLLHQGAAMSAVCDVFADTARQFALGEHEGAAEAVLRRLRVLGDVAGRATAATASDARSRASGEDAGSQDGDSGSLDVGRQADAVERVLRHEHAARELAALGRGECCMLSWGLHTCPPFRIAVARLQIPGTEGEAVSGAASSVAMAVSCVEPRLGGSSDVTAADCSLGVSVRYACETKGAAAMVFAQAAAEAARSSTAQWSVPGGGAAAAAAGVEPGRLGAEVYVHAVGVMPTPRSASQCARLADALCAVQEAWEGDWGLRETPHDWYALASDGVPVPMIHRVVEGGGMEMQPGSTAGVNNLWGVAGFAQEAFCWGGKGSGLLGKEVFVYACLEMQ